MKNTILQVPIDRNIRNQAASRAGKMGFSSLQEIVRLFLNKIAGGEIDIMFEETVTLSDKNDKRYAKMIEDVETGKVKTKTFSDTKSLMEYLNSED
ncbi:type II toxin-antitoxin system RelB/DinJ family antitoxin [Patescibacteria group bacterium]|nr:type II toxin-antitoxin system RelB/DinJ family antitoxin [Patescibacteria group bacterium]